MIRDRDRSATTDRPTAEGRRRRRSVARLREATPGDADGIRALVVAAFGAQEGPLVAEMVDAIRVGPHARPGLEWVADADGAPGESCIRTTSRKADATTPFATAPMA